MEIPKDLPVPNSIMDKLICSKCSNYLSVFPIFTLKNGGGNICGRCPTEPDQIRNEVFELVAKNFVFPCKFEPQGCLNDHYPADLAKHEAICDYRIMTCPAVKNTKCKWEGTHRDLLEHFENNHPTFLLKETRFEVDLVHSYEEIYLLPFAGDLFLLKKENSEKSKQFWLSVKHLTDTSGDTAFNFVLVLENVNKTKSKQFAKTAANSLEKKNAIQVNTKEIITTLDHPTTIIAHVTLEPEVPETSESAPKINREMLRILECPVCFEYIVPPIFQCQGGHSVCGPCKNKITQCPTCTKPMADTHNILAESITSYISYPCKYTDNGCSFYCLSQDIKEHELFCKYGLYSCPIKGYDNQCSFVCGVPELIQHIKSEHYDHLLEFDVIHKPFFVGSPDENNDEDCFVLKCFDETFILHYRFADSKISWVMQFIGPPSKAVYFAIDLIDNTGKRQRAYIKKQCCPLTVKNATFDNVDNVLVMTLDQIKPFISDRLSYRVRVLKN